MAEYLLPEKLGHNERLERIEEAVEWERLGRVVGAFMRPEKADRATRL